MQSKNMQSNTTKLSACLLAALWAGNACATDTFNLIGHGPNSLAQGGTGVAYNIGPAGMVVNPATLDLAPEGDTFSVGLDIITADLKIEDTATGEVAKSHTHGRNNGPYVAPELAYVWRRGRYAFGIGSYASDGVGTQFSGDSFLSRTATNNLDTGLRNYSRLLSLRIPFSVAWHATDKLNIGASVDAVWTGVNLGLLLDASQIGTLAQQQRLSGTLVPTLLSVPDLSAGYLNLDNGKIAGGEADAWGLGGRLGLTYDATPNIRLGLAYNFKTHVGDLTGNSGLTAVSASAGNIPLGGSIRLRDFEMPAQVTAGITQALTDQFTLSFDYQRVFWSDVMKNINVGFTQAGTGDTLYLQLPLNYRDTNVFALGAEYRYSPHWTWRAGAHYAQQATPDAGILAIIPNTPTTNVTGGFAYAFGQGSSIDFALAYAFHDTAHNDSQPLTAEPIKGTHGQTVAAVTYTAHF